MKTAAWALALAAALSFSGCENAPDADVQAARGAIETARKLGAEKAAQAGLWEATHYLDSALQEIDQQKKKFFGQDYSQARSLLQTSGEKAREAGVLALKASEDAKAAVAKASATKDTLAQFQAAAGAASTAAGAAPRKPATKNTAESAINLVYAEYQRARREVGTGGAAGPIFENVMKLLKDARSELKARNYAGAENTAKSAEEMLGTLPK